MRLARIEVSISSSDSRTLKGEEKGEAGPKGELKLCVGFAPFGEELLLASPHRACKPVSTPEDLGLDAVAKDLEGNLAYLHIMHMRERTI